MSGYLFVMMVIHQVPSQHLTWSDDRPDYCSLQLSIYKALFTTIISIRMMGITTVTVIAFTHSHSSREPGWCPCILLPVESSISPPPLAATKAWHQRQTISLWCYLF